MAIAALPPPELTLPHLGRLEGLVPAGAGRSGWVFRASCARGAVGLKVSQETGAAGRAVLTREAIARAVATPDAGPLDGGMVDLGGSAHACIAFAWVEGTPLSRWSPAHGSESQAVGAIACDVASALARLHAFSWRHGDVKPDNIVVRGDGETVRASLIDLGLAAPFAESLVGGTPAYLAPEILNSTERHAAWEADVFALGVVLRETATRFGTTLVERLASARAPLPGDRPTAATLAGWHIASLPVDAAYLLLRLPEIEQASRDGTGAPRGLARPWVEGLLRTLAGLVGVRPSEAAMPPLDRSGCHALLVRVVGSAAREWPLPAHLRYEDHLLAALVQRTTADGVVTLQDLRRIDGPNSSSNSPSAPAGLVQGTDPEALLSRAIARRALHPEDEEALSELARITRSSPSGVSHDTARAALTLLRRGSRLAEARVFADARVDAYPNDPACAVDAAELARLSGDSMTAEQALRGLCSKHPECGTRPDVAALLGRLALDRGAFDLADAALSVADDHRDGSDGALAEVHALRAHAAGDHARALLVLDHADPADPERRARLLIVRGMVHHARGTSVEALRAFARGADLALALSAPALEAGARASAAAAGHDAGLLAEALDAADRAIGLLERLGRTRDLGRARLARAAILGGLGARNETVAEARRAEEAAMMAGDTRAAAYALWARVEAIVGARTSNEPAASLAEADGPESLARLASARLGGTASKSDQLQSLSFELLAGALLPAAAIERGDAWGLEIDVPEARWNWWRARLAAGNAPLTIIDLVVRARDDEAPPTLVGPTLALALAESRRMGLGERSRALAERRARLLAKLRPHVPLSHRASFDAQQWTRSEGGRSDELGIGAGQIELLGAIARGLRDRTSLADLLRQVLDGLVLWVGVERGLLLLRAPAPRGEAVATDNATPAPRLGGPEAEPRVPRLVARVARGLSREDLHGEQLILSNTLALRALETLEPVVAVDAFGETPADLQSSIHALRLRSVLAVPLVARGEALGVVYLDDRIRKGAFGVQEVAWVRLLATQAAAAIADTRDAIRLRRLARRAERARSQLEHHLARTEGDLEIVRAQLAQVDPAKSPGSDPRGTRFRYDEIVGDSAAIRTMLHLVDRVALDGKIPVLVTGESGTGKELVARAIHHHGPRNGRAFVAENCSAIPEPLLESTLFGHVRGAFTGADRARVGLFEIANGGTLFLDEIGEMGHAMQAKLLRVLQDGEVRPVGSDRVAHVDVRIVAATHRDLEAMVADGRFRQDLYYRLAVVTVRVPALRERTEDLPSLIEHLVRRHGSRRSVRITKRALAAMGVAGWPGNIRQLENELRRALVLCDDVLDQEHLSAELTTPRGTASAGGNAMSLREQVAALESRLVRDAMRRADGNQTHAARDLGMSRFGLQKMLKRQGAESGAKR